MVTAKGPSVGTYKERDIPAWIEARGGHYAYNRLWDEKSGELSQLARDELVIAPGLIYKLQRYECETCQDDPQSCANIPMTQCAKLNQDMRS